MGEGGTAVILKRTEPGICVDLIASGRQITTAIITAQIVAERSHRGRPVGVILVINVPTGRTSIENRASNRQSRIADGAGVIDAAAVVDGRVAAKSAVDDRERVRVPDAAAFARVAAAGGVATKRAVGDRHRPGAIVKDAAALVGRVAAQSAVGDRQSRGASGGAAIEDSACGIFGRVAADCAVAQR